MIVCDFKSLTTVFPTILSINLGGIPVPGRFIDNISLLSTVPSGTS